MKKKLSLLMVALVAVAAFAGLRRAATDVTLDFTSTDEITAMGFGLPEAGKGINIESAFTYRGITITPYAGTTPVRIWNSSGAYTLRYFKANTEGVKGGIGISVPDGNKINSIAITGNTQLQYTIADAGNIEMSSNNKTLTWTPGEAEIASVKFENNGSSTVNVEKITVSYEPAGGAEPTTKSVTFENDQNWEKVYVWAWNGDENFTGGQWPGVEITPVEGVYTWSTTDDPAYIIFSNGTTQTADLVFEDGATYNSQGKVVPAQTFTVTFKNNGNWAEVYAYAWTDGYKYFGEWPGKKIDATDAGYVLSFEATAAPEKIIFNNNAGEQTANLDFVNGKTYNIINNIEALNAQEDKAEFDYFGEALIVAKPTAKYVYIKDETGSSLIYNNTGSLTETAEVGKTLAANWTGKVSIYNGLFEAVPAAAIAVKEGDAVAVSYDVVTAAAVVEANINKVVEIDGLTISNIDAKNISFTIDEAAVVGYNQFGITLPEVYEGKTYNVVGAIGRYKENIQFWPITIEVVDALGAAKAALQAAIDKAKAFNTTGLADIIATAQTAVDDENATIESIQAAAATFEAGVKTYLQYVLNTAIPMVESLNAESLADAINTAKAALANEDATAAELADALFGMIEPARLYIVGILQQTVDVCKPLGIDTSAAEAALSQGDEASTVGMALTLYNLTQTAIPAIQGVVTNLKAYMTTFSNGAAEALADDFAKLESDIANGDIAAVKNDIVTLMTNGKPYLQSDIEKLEGHASVIGNADITNDVAAMKAAVNEGSFTALLAAVESFKAHFLAAAPGFVQQIKNAVAGYKAAGKTESIDQVETAILTAEQALGEEGATIVTVGLAVRNLILAFQAYAEANPSYTIAGTKDLTGTEEDWQLVEANNMTKNAETGLYEWTATNIAVSEDNQPQFKVVITDINGNQTWIPASEEGNDHNWVITLGALGSAEEGLYDITITFDATTNEIAVAGVRKSDIPEDIYVKLEESCDIAAAVNAAMVDKNVGAVTIELTKDVAYTFNSTIEVPGALTVWGNDAVIDASALEGNMFQWKAKAAEDTEWTTANVEIAGVKITGLKKALFYSNGKYYVAKNFNINWVNVELAADATTFDFTKGSTAENFTVMNSTFYAPTATTKSFYSSQSGQKTTEWSSSAVQTFKFHNNTMYNLARAKNFFTHRQNSQKWLTFDIQENIFVNCGKSGQVIKGFNGGGSSANPTWIVKGNAFNFDGADTSADESTGDDAEPIQDSVAGVVTFTDAASGDFNGEFQLAEDATEPENKIGAPAWTITFKEAPHGLIPNGTYYVMSANEGSVINAEGALDAKGAPITFTFNAANNAYTIEGADFFAGKQWTVAEAIEGMSGFYTISTAEGFLAAGEANALEQIADGTADAAVWILLEKAYWEDIVNSTYTVAGTKNLTGTENDWELAEANQMVFNEETGLFEKKFKRIAVNAENQPEFKVVQTPMEGESTWYPTDGNWVITTDYVGGEGLYDITITFDPSDFKEIGVIAEARIVFPENAIVYDFEAAADAGENPANKNGSAGNGQGFYGWENPEKTDSKRQDYKGYEWAEGSVLPEDCHVWRRSDRINGNVAGNGGLKCPSNKEMAIDGLNPGDKVIIVYDAENATDKEIIWAIGDGTSEGGPGAVRATATIGGAEAVSGTTTIASGAEIIVNSVTPAENGTGYIVFQVKKGMIIQQIAVIKAPVVVPEYYLTGTMTSWSVDAAELASYKLVANEEAEGEYMITLDLEAGAEFKAVAIDADNNLTWYPESNCSVNDAGNYTIYFRPAGNTEWEWNYLYANYNGPATGINAVSTAANNAVIFNMAGQRVEKAQKGLYIVNGKKVVLK